MCKTCLIYHNSLFFTALFRLGSKQLISTKYFFCLLKQTDTSEKPSYLDHKSLCLRAKVSNLWDHTFISVLVADITLINSSRRKNKLHIHSLQCKTVRVRKKTKDD